MFCSREKCFLIGACGEAVPHAHLKGALAVRRDIGEFPHSAVETACEKETCHARHRHHLGFSWASDEFNHELCADGKRSRSIYIEDHVAAEVLERNRAAIRR